MSCGCSQLDKDLPPVQLPHLERDGAQQSPSECAKALKPRHESDRKASEHARIVSTKRIHRLTARFHRQRDVFYWFRTFSGGMVARFMPARTDGTLLVTGALEFATIFIPPIG
jgi:hypothetical protein